MAMASSAADQSLEKVRNEIALTREWASLHQTIGEESERALKSDHRLSTDQKALILKKVIETVKDKDESYQKLEEKVPVIVQQHFFSNPKTKKAKPKTQLIDQASAGIIQQWPQFRSHLKIFINLPLPVHLRKAAWNAFLINAKVRQDFLAAHEGMKPDDLLKKNPKLSDMCKKFLQAGSLNELRKMDFTLHTMCAVVKFWEIRTSNEATKPEILLCIPFIYCCSHELKSISRQSSDCLDWTVPSEVAEMYCAFMEMMPLNMKTILHNPKSATAVTILCKEIESLLNVSEPKLAAQLNKILQISTSKETRPDNSSFLLHKQLIHLVHPFLQRMFVDVCSLETVSFILDQCFIFMELPKFKFMPYCIATWIILLKRKLMNCHNVESVFETLSKYSVNLTVENFQKEIEQRFLSDIKKGIQIEIDLEDNEEPSNWRSLLSSRIGQDEGTVKVKQHLLMSNGSTREKIVPKEIEANEDVDQKPLSKLNQQESEQLELLKTQVLELLENQNRQGEIAEKMVMEERKLHQSEMEELRKEMATMLNEKMKERDITTGITRDRKTPTIKSPTPRLPSALPKLPETKRPALNTSHIPADPMTAKADPAGFKKFDPNSLSSSDVQELNLILLSKFKEAMYLICHGSEEEKEELQHKITKSKLPNT